MPAKNELASNPSINATATAATNTASVVTITAKTNAGLTTYITGIILSSSGTIAAAVAPTLSGVQGGTLTLQLPAAQVAPVVVLFGVHPLRITPGVDAVLTLPALGSGIVGSATLLYYYGAE